MIKGFDLGKQFKTNVEVEEGEEKLHQSYDFATVDKTVKMLVGVDGGSTQTRVMIVDDADDPDMEQYIIPSVSSFVPSDIEIRPQGDSLYNRMDSYLINGKTKTQTIFTKKRVIRGTKKTDFNGSEERISSSAQKIASDVFYINVIDAIGYALCQKFTTNIPKHVKLILGIALPPDDRASSSNINRFRNEMNGIYTWKHTDSGVEINIEIEECHIMTEPEAFIKAYYISMDQDIPEITLHINGGGRSIGIELLENGVPIDSVSRTLAYGGAKLIDDLGVLYAKEKGGRAPQTKTLQRAIKTGFMRNGKGFEDVSDLVSVVKKEFAGRIFKDVIKYVFDTQSEITLRDVGEISVSGRIFDEGECAISVAKYLQEEFYQASPQTEFFTISENFIPLGLIYGVFGEYGGFLEEDEESVAEVVSDNIE